MLNINIGISAAPFVSFIKPEAERSAVPDLSAGNHPGGFNVHMEAAFQYDSLSKVITEYIAGRRIEVSEGLFKKHIIIENATVSGEEDGHMKIRLDFKGSFNGTVFLTGKPVYNQENKSIEVKDMDYDLQTRNLLLKTGRWLFNNRILSELKKYTSFGLSDYYTKAAISLNGWLNREWTKGIRGAGSVSDLKLTAVYALPQHLLIRTNCAGKLSITVSEIDLRF